MNIPKPEERKCETCSNSMTINYFRLNSSICRYCEDGLIIPDRLITKIAAIDANTTINTNSSFTVSGCQLTSNMEDVNNENIDTVNSTESLSENSEDSEEERTQLELLS